MLYSSPRHAVTAVMAMLLLCLCPTGPVDACEGTPRRQCSRSIWFTMLVPENIALPPAGQVNIPLVLMPYVFWDTIAPCAQPALWSGEQGDATRAPLQAHVTVDMMFTSHNSGTMMDLGVQQFQIALNGPGLQTMEVSIDVSDLPRDETWVGNLSGTCMVNFENGQGEGSLSAVGDATVCLIPPCDAEGDMPMVGLEYLRHPVDEMTYQTCRRGDQAYFHFALTNYCLDKSAIVDLSTNIKQLAGLPIGFPPADITANYQKYVHADANPLSDFFNHVLYQGGPPCTQLPEGDLHNNPTSQQLQVTLNAGESKTVTVIMVSGGGCGNGSCNKIDLGGEVTMSDGTETYVCSSTAYYVDDALPKSRRCEYEDYIKTDVSAGTCYTPASYFDIYGPLPHATTHTYGSEFAGGWCLFGENVSSGQKSEATDRIRFFPEVAVYGMMYSLSYTGQTGFGENDVVVMMLPEMVNEPVVIPVITYSLDFHISIGIQYTEDFVMIQSADQSMTYYEGSWSEFMDSPPPDFSYDMNSCRTFTKTYDPSGIDICPEMYSYCYLNRPPESKSHVIGVVDQNGSPVAGTASLIGLNSGIVETSPTFSADIDLMVMESGFPSAPEYLTGWLCINSTDAVAPYYVPMCFSQLDNMDIDVFNEVDLCKAYDVATARWSNTNLILRSDFAITKPCTNWANSDFSSIIGDIQQPAGSSSSVPVEIDGSNCATPCLVMRVEGNNNLVRDIVFVGFPEVALTVEGDGNAIENCVFTDNQGIGLMLSGNDNSVGTDAGGGNAFTNNAGGGIVVMSGTGNAILSNTFDENAGLPIDLGGDGRTPNDPGDEDEGANNLQNFPVLSSAEVTPGMTTVAGSLNSTASTTFSIQFYSTDTCTNTGIGEGMVLLESMDVTTDANGDVDFEMMLSSTVMAGQYITALVTDPDGNTSEFSMCSDAIISDVGVLQNDVFAMHPAMPNPFASETTITFELNRQTDVLLYVMDVMGRIVDVLEDVRLPAGQYTVTLSANHLSPGMYICRMEAGGFVAVQKMVVKD